jgi:hypothetical protein
MTARTRGAVVAAVFALALLAACGENGTTFTDGDVTVVDESGLVTGIDVAAQQPPDASSAGAPSATPANGHLDEVQVVWVGSSCDGGSVLHLQGNALTLAIAPRQPPGEGCTDRLRWVTLLLNVVVDAGNITISQAGG